MAAEWEVKKLGELTENYDGQRIPVKESDRKAGIYPYYGASGVVDHVDSFTFDGEYLLIAEDGENLRSRKTPIAFLARGKFWVNNHAHIVKGNSKADTRFLMYALNSGDINGYLTGSTMPKLTQGSMNRIPILAPPLPEQRAIVSVLGALDDKIELNRRMNETLEALAQTLFKSWFVDPTLSTIPKGWHETALGKIVDLCTDRIKATPEKDNERYIALEDMPSKSIDLSHFQAGSAVNSSIIRFRKDDILFGSMRPYFHKVGLASFDGITRTTTFVLRPKQNHLRHFALFHFFSNEVIEFSTTSSVGTTIPYIKWDALERYPIALPPDLLLEQFEAAVSPLVQRIANNGEESRTLAALRDALLPKLLSGELRLTTIDQ